MGLKEDLAAATVTKTTVDPTTKATSVVEVGIRVVKKTGDIINAQPGSVVLAADIEKGIYLKGLKEGERLCTPAEWAAAEKAAQKPDNELEVRALREQRAAGAPKSESKKPA